MICVCLETLMFQMKLLPQEECLIEFGDVMVSFSVKEKTGLRYRLGEYHPYAKHISVFRERDQPRGGLWGTFIHEFCHAIQCQLGDWQGSKELYNKWSRFFSGTYAGKDPREAEAEVFRWLWMARKGYLPTEAWEGNWVLLSEYEKYFRKKGWGKYLPPTAF